MPWVKIDDRFPGHPKVASLSPAWRPLAVFLHINALCWCNQYLTDGRVPRSDLSRLGAGIECLEMQGRGSIDAHEVADELVAVGLWEEDGGDYIIHDFREFQPSRRQVEARRRQVSAIRSESGSKGGSKSASKRAANRTANAQQTVQQTDQQTCSPVPDPLIKIPPTPQEAEGGRSPASGPSVGDLWDHWRAVAEQHGVLEDAIISPKAYDALRRLFERHTLDALRGAVTAFWTTPHFHAKRHIGMFIANVPQLVAHVASGDAAPFGVRPSSGAPTPGPTSVATDPERLASIARSKAYRASIEGVR